MSWVVLRIGRELLFFRRSLLGGEFIYGLRRDTGANMNVPLREGNLDIEFAKTAVQLETGVGARAIIVIYVGPKAQCRKMSALSPWSRNRTSGRGKLRTLGVSAAMSSRV